MTEDNGCKVCGKHFEDAEDLKNHGKYDHPEVQENFPDIFDKKEEQPAEEIDQQEDKPVQTHDDWKKDLDSMRDEYSTEQEEKCAICDGEHPTSEHPVLETHTPEHEEEADEQEEEHVPPMTPIPNEDVGDYKDDLQWDDKTNHYVKKSGEQEEKEYAKHDNWQDYQDQQDERQAEEEGGADDPLKKVADLAESYRYMSKDHRASLFESLDFTQGDSAILSGLEWNELTRPIKVEASEAYIKEQQEPEPKEYEGIDEDEEENKAYESLYNLEKYHSSPDYKKKAITCNRCNEAFYNTNDRNIHFNDVHATEQEYKLPETCPYCNIEIHEPDNLDWHMQEEHGAHVPSQFTQTGVAGAMADTDYDSLESHKKKASEDYIPDPYDKHFDWVASMDQDDYVCKHCGQMMMANGDALHTQPQNVIVDVVKQHLASHGITESKANEGELASYPDEDEYTDSEFGSTRPKAKEDEPWDLDPTFDEPDGMVGNYAPPSDELEDGDAEEGGAGSGPQRGGTALLPEQSAMKNINPDYDPFKATPKSQLMQTDPYVTRTTEEAPDTNKSELETEIKDLENFINMASYENPLNMGEFQDKLDGLKSELSSLGENKETGTMDLDDTTAYVDDSDEWEVGDDGIMRKKKKKKDAEVEDEEDEDDNEDYPEGWDKRKPTIGGYDPELDYDG